MPKCKANVAVQLMLKAKIHKLASNSYIYALTKSVSFNFNISFTLWQITYIEKMILAWLLDRPT